MMRRIAMWLSVLAMVVCAGGASAITANGDWSDWFTYGGNTAFSTWNENAVTPSNLNIRTLSDEEGPTPGGGDQDYDVEQIFYMYDDLNPNATTGGTLYIGLVTGFDPFGENLGGTAGGPHYAGDMFLDLGNSGSYGIAIATGKENTPENDGGARFGQAWYNTGLPNWTLQNTVNFSPQSDPYRVNEDLGTGDAPISALGYSVTVAWGNPGGVHNFLEIALTVDGAAETILTDPNGGIGLHWTMLCGNDEIDVHDDTPFVPVPEPATMVLLGMGVLGIALRARRPQC